MSTATKASRKSLSATDHYDDQGLSILWLPSKGMLCVGEKLYWFRSARTTLSRTAREVLLPVLAEATAAREPVERTRDFHGSWRVRATPVICPKTNLVVAVDGCYIPKSQTTWPSPFQVGAWAHWPKPYGPQRLMPSYPSDGLFALYGLEPTDAEVDEQTGERYWHIPQIRRDVVHPDDRWTLMSSLDQMNAATDTAPITCTFRVGHHESPRWVRAIGWKTDQWVNGVVHEIRDPSQIPDRSPNDFRGDFGNSFLQRYPTATIEPYEGYVAMSNKLFQDLVALPANNHVDQMIHPDDQGRFTAVCKEVASGEWSHPLHELRFWTGSGWRSLSARVWSLPMHHEVQPSYVACEVWDPRSQSA